MVKESIQITEESVMKLMAAGAKNLAPFLLALTQDNKKAVRQDQYGPACSGRQGTKVFSIRESDLEDFKSVCQEKRAVFRGKATEGGSMV